MTKEEWDVCNDAKRMIEYLWEREPYLSIKARFLEYPPKENWVDYLEFDAPLHRYYLASCRNIWELLPQEESRRGVELAEQFVAGDISWEQVSEYNWHTEGAAFYIEYNQNPEQITSWCKRVELFSSKKLSSLLSSEKKLGRIDPRELLLSAANFADYAMIYPSIVSKGPPKSHTEFMFADPLRRYIAYPD